MSFISMLAVFILALAITPNSPAQEMSLFESVTVEKAPASTHRLILNEEDIKNSGAQNLTQLLSKLGGISLYSTATTENQMFLRGGDGSHVLVLLDGVPFYDPTSLQRSLNINSIPLKLVGKVEIIKGAQVVRYGGQALAGVIAISTLKKSDKNTQIRLETGSLEESNAADKIEARTLNQNKIEARQNFKALDNTDIQLSGQWDQSATLSPAKNSEKIYPKSQYSWDALSQLETDKSKWLLRARDSRSKKDILARTIDANNFEALSDLKSASFVFETKSENKSKFHATLVDASKSYYKAVADSPSAPAFEDRSSGQLIHIGAEQILSFLHSDFFVGMSHSNERYKGEFVQGYGPFVPATNTDDRQEITGGYLLWQKNWTEHFVTNIGVRHEKYLSLGEKTSFQAGGAWKNWKLEYAEAYKAPSLGQLNNVLYGNKNLKAESSKTLSLEYSNQFENYSYSFSPFWSEYTDLIAPAGNPLKYDNVSAAEIWGVELSQRLNLETQSFALNYTYQHPRERGADRWLVRRPLWLAGGFWNKQWGTAWSTNVDFNAMGKRQDQLQNGGRIDLEPYITWNLGADYTLGNGLNLYTKIRNIFHDRHEDSSGFLAQGRLYLVGLEWQN